ncbi:MAG: PAS domain S-box protein [Limnobacter sp.]|uniref:PAS domain S-box protein n=1 Tax=Limnobacter sp. TaxID=2003368 RepID=UPI00391B2320
MQLKDQPRTSPLVWATPLVGMVLFIVAMGAFFYNLYVEDQSQAQIRVTRDVENARSNIRTRLLTAQERLTQLARSLEVGQNRHERFTVPALALMAEFPEINSVVLIDQERRVVELSLPRLRSAIPVHPLYETIEDAESYWAYNTARETRLPVFSRPYLGQGDQVYMEIHSPVIQDGDYLGSVAATLPLGDLLNRSFPDTFVKLYSVSIVDGGGNLIASNVSRSVENAKLSHEVPLEPPGHGLKLRAVLYRTTSELFSNMLAWTVIGLSLIVIWSFALLFRHAKLRSQAERRLLEETKFRRAMENSVITGMRAIDLQGRITYVNPAFCRMTGFAEDELVGLGPPFPYWPEDSGEQRDLLDLILVGKAPAKGIEVQVKRRDGTLFDARMYVSPLVDSEGRQTGWMTSVTDITEPRRVREELAAAHRRFVRILEELDAAVSIRVPDGKDNEFIFVNRLHREWFSKDSPPKFTKTGRGRPARDAGMQPFEWLCENSRRWYEVRRRSISWVDGTTVIMQVATDITSRKEAEDMSRQQQEKLQFTSRLITLGELASSLAHEINQPLAAISNYNMGSVNRLKSGKVTPEELLPVLEKVNIQAQRAGDVIRRIREFVKQQEPKRSACHLGRIIDDAVGFSQLEASHRGARIEQRLLCPDLQVMADSVLIEQVLMNLIKNGLESMSHLPDDQKLVEITVDEHSEQLIVVKVRDRGTGVPESIRTRLFESFFTTKPEGMGMGLNICRTIIEYHQGKLWVDPAPDQGSVFTFTLPKATG